VCEKENSLINLALRIPTNQKKMMKKMVGTTFGIVLLEN